jgi:nucleoside-diphosphate-sugar epimerase
MKILITGGNGFIGSKLVEILSQKHRVSILDNDLTYGLVSPAELQKYYDYRQRNWKNIGITLKGDVRDADVGLRAFKSNPDVVIHLAAYPRAKLVQDNPLEGISQIVDGTTNMLWHAEKFGVKKFVYVSSSMVYGNYRDGTAEDDDTKPTNIYGEAKLMGERLTKHFAARSGLKYNIIRPSGVYGPGDLPDRVLSKFFEAAMNNKSLNVHNGKNKVDFTYVDDTATGIAQVSLSEVYNTSFKITAGNAVSLQTAAKMVVRVTGSKSKIVDTGRNQLYPDRGTLDINRAKKYIKYKPQYDFKTGLEQYYDWIKQWPSTVSK